MFARAQNPKIDFFFFYNNNKKIRGTDFYKKKAPRNVFTTHFFFFTIICFRDFTIFFIFNEFTMNLNLQKRQNTASMLPRHWALPPSIWMSFSSRSSIPNDSSYAYYSLFSSILKLYLNIAQLAMCEVSFSPIFLLDSFIVTSKLFSSLYSSFHRLFQVWNWRKADHFL
jgi:hypothetical protein